MAKKNNDIPDDLIGFKEFIEYEEKKRPTHSRRSKSSGLHHLSFLESESQRLSKTLELCEEQTFGINRYPQDKKILEKQDQLIEKNRMIIIELLRRKDSPLTKNLTEIFKIHFGN